MITIIHQSTISSRNLRYNHFSILLYKRQRMSDINRIKAVLVEKKISSRLLAEYVKRSVGTVSRWCNNKSQPHVNDLSKIAEFLRIDIRELLIPHNWGAGPSPAEVLKVKREKEKKDLASKRSKKKASRSRKKH
jgi:putative transcriptional regulator